MLWCEGAQNIGLSNHKLKSTLTCTTLYDHNAHPSQTDRWTNITAIVWRFVIKKHCVLKISRLNMHRVTTCEGLMMWLASSWMGNGMPSSEANEVIGARVPLVRTTERMPRLISVNACVKQLKSTQRVNSAETPNRRPESDWFHKITKVFCVSAYPILTLSAGRITVQCHTYTHIRLLHLAVTKDMWLDMQTMKYNRRL